MIHHFCVDEVTTWLSVWLAKLKPSKFRPGSGARWIPSSTKILHKYEGIVYLQILQWEFSAPAHARPRAALSVVFVAAPNSAMAALRSLVEGVTPALLKSESTN